MRRAADTEAEYVTELLALAFYDDPLWSWVFADPQLRLAHQRAWWELFVGSAARRGSIWMSDGGESAAVWVPPDEPELGEAEEARIEPMLRELVGSHTDAVLELLDSFEANHPHDRPHHYLSLLATHPAHRGHGTGMALLAECLKRTDAEGLPVFLESSNRANDDRYARVGFEQIGEFSAPGGGPTLVRMWREPQPAGGG